LKRVHDKAAETLEVKEPTSSETIAERFNQVLEDFQAEYAKNERLAQIEPVEGTKASIRRIGTHESANEDLREIKLRTEQIADIFELDVADFEQVDEVTEMRPIVIRQNTEVSQETEVNQSVEYTQIIDQVDQAMLGPEDAEDLKELIREFQNEVESDDTDESRLRNLAGRAKQFGAGIGTQVGAKLTMAGLQAGYDLIP
jgi:serine phosphatase RsbU (regulator of sigma subunit)